MDDLSGPAGGLVSGRGGEAGAPPADTAAELDESLFAALSARSRASNLARVDRLLELLRAWTHEPAVEPDQYQQAVDLVHQVVGSAGTFGFGEVSDLGRVLEELLLSSDLLRADVVADLNRQATAMRAALVR